MSIRLRRIGGLAIGIVLSFQTVSAQKSPPAPGGGTLPGTTRLPPGPSGQPTGQAQPALNGSIYLSGTVLLDDGTPPPESVTIERICNGAPRAQAYTDRKGRFSFQIGQTSTVMQDASEEGSNRPVTSIIANGQQAGQFPNAPDMLLANCDLRAVLSGFRSDRVSLGARRLLDDPNVGTIVLHRLANVEGSAISVTSLQAPKDARQAYYRALQNIRKNKLPEASKDLHKAVELYPRYAAAWYELGRLQVQDQQIEQARKSFNNAVAADSKFISPYAQLAELDAKAEDWTALIVVTSKLLNLDSVDYPMAYFYNATGNLNVGQIETAEKSARDGIKLDAPHRFPRLEQVLAMILARKKDYAGAAAHLRNYLALSPDAEDGALMKKELGHFDLLAAAADRAKTAETQN